jgi:hypothetical protein
MMMMVMILMVTMVAALRKSCGLIQLILGGLMTQMENDNGRWNKWVMDRANDVSARDGQCHLCQKIFKNFCEWIKRILGKSRGKYEVSIADDEDDGYDIDGDNDRCSENELRSDTAHCGWSLDTDGKWW